VLWVTAATSIATAMARQAQQLLHIPTVHGTALESAVTGVMAPAIAQAILIMPAAPEPQTQQTLMACMQAQ